MPKAAGAATKVSVRPRRSSKRASSRGRTLDNVFVERLWRTVKYEHVYLNDYNHVPDPEAGLHGYFLFYNHERLHQSPGYRTPAEVYYA